MASPGTDALPPSTFSPPVVDGSPARDMASERAPMYAALSGDLRPLFAVENFGFEALYRSVVRRAVQRLGLRGRRDQDPVVAHELEGELARVHGDGTHARDAVAVAVAIAAPGSKQSEDDEEGEGEGGGGEDAAEDAALEAGQEAAAVWALRLELRALSMRICTALLGPEFPAALRREGLTLDANVKLRTYERGDRGNLGPHVDGNFITLLWSDAVGLEVPAAGEGADGLGVAAMANVWTPSFGAVEDVRTVIRGGGVWGRLRREGEERGRGRGEREREF